MPKRMLTIKEAADISEVTRAAVYSWVRDRKLPSTYDRERGCYLIHSRDLTALNRQRAPAASNGGKTAPMPGNGRHHKNGGKKSGSPGQDGSVSGKGFWTMREAMERTGLSRNRIMKYRESGDIELFRNPSPGRSGNPGYAISDSDLQKLMSGELDGETHLPSHAEPSPVVAEKEPPGRYEKTHVMPRIPAYTTRSSGNGRKVVINKRHGAEKLRRLVGLLSKYSGYSGLSEYAIRFFNNVGDADFIGVVLGDRPSGRELRNMEYIAIASEMAAGDQMRRFMEIYRNLDSNGRDHMAHEFYRSGDKEAALRGEIAVGGHEGSEVVELGGKNYTRHTFLDGRGHGIYWTGVDDRSLPIGDMIDLERGYSSGLPGDMASRNVRRVRAYDGE
ncbi:MAG: helix-turn-helix domain-containing protein [Candidatus Aenigmarchaeota archaeon]|nr:helix-turn-helix domain-containing protein [Candidatus Aenigmarchaeota archaeon]